MLLVVIIQHFVVSPKIVELGRAMDFTTTEDVVPERESFWNYHRAYSGVEMLKLISGLALAMRLLYSSRSIRRKRVEADGTEVEAEG
jgi:hypothetical protein